MASSNGGKASRAEFLSRIGLHRLGRACLIGVGLVNARGSVGNVLRRSSLVLSESVSQAVSLRSARPGVSTDLGVRPRPTGEALSDVSMTVAICARILDHGESDESLHKALEGVWWDAPAAGGEALVGSVARTLR